MIIAEQGKFVVNGYMIGLCRKNIEKMKIREEVKRNEKDKTDVKPQGRSLISKE